MPLNRLVQSLAFLLLVDNEEQSTATTTTTTDTVTVNHDKNTFLNIRTLKVFIQRPGQQLPQSVNALVFSSIGLASATLCRLTLYSVEINESLLKGLQSTCKQLERLCIYPTNWSRLDNDVLLRLLDSMPLICELAIKISGTMNPFVDNHEHTMDVLAPLAKLEKYVWIGGIESYGGFLVSQVWFNSMTNLRDLKIQLNSHLAEYEHDVVQDPNWWARSILNKDKLRRLRLINCYSPDESNIVDASHSRLDVQNRVKTDIQVHNLLRQISTLKALSNLTLKEIKYIEPIDLTSCLDSLPLLTRFKFSISPKTDSGGLCKKVSATTSISVALLTYLETAANSTITHFSYTLQHELNAWLPLVTVYNDCSTTAGGGGHNNISTTAKAYRGIYDLEELTHLASKLGQIKKALESLVQNSEAIQELSIGSTIEPYHCCTQKKDVVADNSNDHLDLVSSALLTSFQSSTSVSLYGSTRLPPSSLTTSYRQK
ncbi:hypothetical protein DFA_00252 [Cavenderia fasciculata]|uniref:Uncharacterized protein n=1 Tax=Cavenderia fasciculata TaxID=261658 RepID=F4PY14_CACFS|nr:uncharacterized protein DFA_00252 [Cavenderia fasciculata]EGG19674.1 hypothetical protein DFA_00252 [Cavenderia fasciculata]|eukprot:XP_004357968.1 hypothetical protein DFA_00252 [Cavenderia fasciculata]